MNMIRKSMLILAGLIAFPAFAAVNINTATQSELEVVKGLGPAKAKAIIQYREGITDFTTVLIAQRALLNLEDQLAQSNGTVTANLIRLYKALGGGWQPAEPPAAMSGSAKG